MVPIFQYIIQYNIGPEQHNKQKIYNNSHNSTIFVNNNTKMKNQLTNVNNQYTHIYLITHFIFFYSQLTRTFFTKLNGYFRIVFQIL